MTDFTGVWSLPSANIVGIEIAQSPVNADTGSYGFRSIGISALTCAAGAVGGAYVNDVNGDTGRGNAEVLTIRQVSSAAVNSGHRFGALVRGSGATGAESGYVAYIAETPVGYPSENGAVTLVIAKYVSGVEQTIASASISCPNTSQDMYIRFRVNGTALNARCWKYGTIEPSTWSVSGTDSSITGVGYVGLFCRSVSANSMTFDFPGFVSVGTSGETAPRPRSELEFRDWINNTSNERVILAEMGVYGQTSGGAGNPSKVLVSNWPFTTRGSEAPRNQAYDDVIVDIPVFTSRVAEKLTGRPTQAFGDLVIKNEGGVRDPWLTWNWDGGDFTMLLGGVGWQKWDFYRVMSGSIYEAYSPSKDKIGFKIRDKSVLLNRKVQTSVIGGATANAGLPQPIVLGKVFNAQPQLKDATALRYKFHDGSLVGTTGITAVRDSGVSVSYTADLANGEFTLVSSPTNTGGITVDVTNNLTGYKHADMLTNLAGTRGGLGTSALYTGARTGSLASFGASYSAPVGLYLKEETNLMDALDTVTESAGGFWYFNRLGQFCAALVRVPTSPYDHVLYEDDLDTDVRIDRLIRPSAVEQLGYQRNFTPQTSGLAGAVSISDRALYAAPAQYTTVVPTYSGLDQPANHSLRQIPRNRDTLFTLSSDAGSEVSRLDTIYRKQCGIFSFTTKVNSVFYNLGESLQLTYSRYGFQAGKAGIIVGLEENFEKTAVRITLFVQIDGQFPVTDITEPYVTAKDFYAN